MHDHKPLFEAILNGKATDARALTEAALAAGTDPLTLHASNTASLP